MTGFDQFYSRYPRREARKDAEKAWRQGKCDDHLDVILAALDWQVPFLLQRDRQYRPLPASWLRGERWMDENPAAEREAAASERAKLEAEEREFQARRKARIDAEAQVFEFQRRRA